MTERQYYSKFTTPFDDPRESNGGRQQRGVTFGSTPLTNNRPLRIKNESHGDEDINRGRVREIRNLNFNPYQQSKNNSHMASQPTYYTNSYQNFASNQNSSSNQNSTTYQNSSSYLITSKFLIESEFFNNAAKFYLTSVFYINNSNCYSVS